MKNVPAYPYLMIVRNYAKAKGLKFWTVRDMKNVIALYEEKAKLLN